MAGKTLLQRGEPFRSQDGHPDLPGDPGIMGTDWTDQTSRVKPDRNNGPVPLQTARGVSPLAP